MSRDPYHMLVIDDGVSHAKARFKKRRNALADACQMPLLIWGVPHGLSGEYPWCHLSAPVFQEPLILYLTGVNQAQIALFLDPHTQTEVLFLPDYDENAVFWNGPRLAVGEPKIEALSRSLTGVKTLVPIKEMKAWLLEYMASHRHYRGRYRDLGMLWHRAKQSPFRVLKDHQYKMKLRVQRWCRDQKKKVHIHNISDVQWRLRARLDDVDIQNLKTAQKLTKEAFLAALQGLKNCRTETEFSGRLQGELLARSPYGLSFAPIVASGENAAILHYVKNSDAFPKNGLLLCDFGLRWQSQLSDISRTLPINGHFNPLQERLYSIVLEAQDLVQAKAKPGVSLLDLNTLCWDFVNDALDKRIRQEGGVVCLPYQRQPHYMGHRMGIQVHDGDPFGNYRDQALEEGMLISNEPGIYGTFEWRYKGKRYQESLGIRVEDNLLITKTGVRNMSAAIPKKVADLNL